MNEFNKKLNLTNRVPTPYSKEDGDNFMEENGEEYKNAEAEESSEKDKAKKDESQEKSEEKKTTKKEQDRQEKKTASQDKSGNEKEKDEWSNDRLTQEAMRLFGGTATAEFQSVLRRATSIEELPQLYKEIGDQYAQLHRKLMLESADDPQNAEKKSRVKALEKEHDQIIRLFTEAFSGQKQREAGPAQAKIIKDIEGDTFRIKGMPESDEKRKLEVLRREKIERLMEIMPDFADQGVPNEILEAIALDRVASEKFISNLTVSDLEDEPYQIRGFYGQINFEKFRRLARYVSSSEDQEYIRHLVETNKSFHDMNYIIKKNFDQFSQQSSSLLPEHFQLISRIPGVASAFRAYEDFYSRILGRDGTVTDESFHEIDALVEKSLESTAKEKDDNGKIAVEGVGGGGLEPWELFRAKIFARNFFRITVRVGEYASLSNLPADNDPALFTSSPEKQFTQLLNTLKFIGFRFKPNEQLGGPELLQSALDSFRKERRSKGVGIKTLQGTDVTMREFQSIAAVRGVFATWRNAEIALSQMRFIDQGKITSVEDFIVKDHKEEIDNLSELFSSKELMKDQWKKESPGSDFEKWEREWKEKKIKELFGPIIDNTNICLGILVSPSMLPIPAELKEIIWREKIAKLDPLVMASLLTRIEMVDKERQVSSLEEILLKHFGSDSQKDFVGENFSKTKAIKEKVEEIEKELTSLKVARDKNPKSANQEKITQLTKQLDSLRLEWRNHDKVVKDLLNGKDWKKLSDLLRVVGDLRVQDEANRVADDKKLNSKAKTLNDYLKGKNLSEKEKEILKEIEENGKKIAPDLARMKQSFAWFLHDTPVEILQWMKLGQFYDRQTGDLANFNKGEGALMKILSAPFSQPAEEILKEFHEAVDGAAQILGLKSAQDNMEPIFREWMRKIRRFPGLDNRQLFASAIKDALLIPTSRAQEIVGKGALSADEDNIQEILDKSVPLGITRRSVRDEKTGRVKWEGTREKLMKEFGTLWYQRFFKSKARDWGPVFFLAAIIAFFKETTRGLEKS